MKKVLYLGIAFLILSCNSDSSDSTNANFSENGQGGSLARFVLTNNYLYTVDNFGLNVFNLSDPEQPVKVNSIPVGFNIETLFNYKEYLYIGSQNGMFIYSIDNPEMPNYLSDVQHFTACDPVVANNTHAFVTLYADVGCGNTINILETYDVTDVLNPVLISTRNLTRPIGMALYGNYLLVCDDEVKVFDIINPENSILVNAIDRNTFDAIIQNNLLILIGENGLFQYNLNPNNIEEITYVSTIDF